MNVFTMKVHNHRCRHAVVPSVAILLALGVASSVCSHRSAPHTSCRDEESVCYVTVNVQQLVGGFVL